MKSVCSVLGVARSNLHVRHHRPGHWQDNRRGRTPAQDGLLLADLRRHIAELRIPRDGGHDSMLMADSVPA
ncbi:hypothetical protein BV908_21970 [Diaphorobacter sp. LR2014-1]|nr:hypothetical protein BV908_21970 [Diaphorobacter sp. LR2014-1]